MRIKYQVCGLVDGNWHHGCYFYENVHSAVMVFYADILNAEKAVVIDLDTGEVLYLRES